MKACSALLLIFLASFTQAQTKLTLTISDQKVGSAVFRQSVDAAGTIHQSVHMMIGVPNAQGDFTYTISTDKTGRPIKEDSTQAFGAKSIHISLDFGAKSVAVTKTENGKTSKHSIPIPKGSLADPSGLWFITTHPKPGTTASHLHLDTQTLKWKNESARYIGHEDVPGTFEKGHHIHHEDGEMWLDDKGMPIRMEMREGGTQMVLTRE